MTDAPPLRAAIYTRQSLDRNGDGLAVERQADACDKLAAQRGWTITARLSDNDTSASNGNPRPGFDAAMAMAAARSVDVIIVWAVDRLVRKLADLERVIETCEQAGVKLATVSGDLDLSTDQGRLVGRILASVARGEVERKSARQKLAAQQSARDGKRWVGCPRPFGWAADHVTADPAERRAIITACRHIAGGSTIAAVVREWNAAGLKPAQPPRRLKHRPYSTAPAQFSRQSVAQILRSPALAGIATYRGQIITGDDGEPVMGDWQPVVRRALWETVQRILRDESRKPPRGVRSLLGGLAVCECGNVITASQNHAGTPIYRCNPSTRDGAAGPHATTARAAIDDFVTRVAVARLSRPDAAELLNPQRRTDIAALQEDAAAIRSRLNEMSGMRALGEITREQYAAATARGNARIAEINAAVADASTQSVLAPIVAADNAARVWAGLDLARRRAVLRALAAIELRPVGRGCRVFDPENVRVLWHQPDVSA